MTDVLTSACPAWLEDILIDPRTGEALTVDDAGAHAEADLVAPLRDGVLRFVDSEAYSESFGRQWNWFARTQLDDRASGRTPSAETFFAKTGWSPADLEGKLVLDVGCGMGRFADVVATHGGRVVGIDLSAAVDAARQNVGRNENVAIVQADVFALPFKLESFDLIYSIGVLHHTPDTRRAFEQLPRLLRPGGRIAIWVYSREPRDRRAYLMSDVYRRATVRMDQERLLRLCRVAVPLGKVFRTRAGRPFRGLMPVNLHPDPDWAILATFDWYSPRYQFKHTWREVEGWFADAGLVDLQRNSMPVAVSGRRP